jgi:hypothetical protein
MPRKRTKWFYTRSPHKSANTKFLVYLRENNYTSVGGSEYNPEEVDAMFYERVQRVSEMLYHQKVKEREKTMVEALLGEYESKR